MTKTVVDTNILLHDLSALDNIENIVILAPVLRELEKHKQNKNELLAYQARQATRFLDKNKDIIEFDLTDYSAIDGYDAGYVDNQIIQACMHNNYSLISDDLLLKMKAKGFGVDVIEVEKKEDTYTGYKEIDVDNKELAYFYENINENIYNLYINQYLILKQFNKCVDKLKWTGKTHINLKLLPKKTLEPQNDEQSLAIDLLNDNNIPIKIIAGTYGSGKTILSVKTAIEKVVHKGDYAKIMMIRNPIGAGESIGWLKGSKEDKTSDFFKPFIQHLQGGEQEAYYLEQRGQLIKEIPFYIKGLSIEDTFVIVDEAEDLDIKLLKLIGTRLGKNSCVVFSGDFNQAENKFLYNNGLKRAIEKLKGNPLVGIVVLGEDVRSEASKVFADLF